MRWQHIDTAPTQGVVLGYIVGDGQSYMTTICRGLSGEWLSNFTMKPIEYGKPVMWIALPWPPETDDGNMLP